MISKSSYTLNWIKAAASKLGRRGDPKLMEKVIYAFTLLEQIRVNELDFIFKGGTSLLLTTSPPRRFSIDIDIITETSIEKLKPIFDQIISTGLFTRWEDDSVRKHTAETPIGHFKFYYKSLVDTKVPEEPVLLDVLYIANPYPSVKEYGITHQWLKTEGEEIKVRVPVYESILGDKLTAFAPTTTGILYSKNRPVEIVKQLYDIGFLYDLSEDIALIKRSYMKVVAEEIGYRKLEISYQEVLKDTHEACLTLALRKGDNPEFIHLQTGLTNITNFIIDRFKIEEAIISAAKAAHLCSLISGEVSGTLERYKGPDQVAAMDISNPQFNKLNKLKKTNPEAFFYWHKTIT
ncbi:MAG: nucleotidyl transferase AbiEii/AbiGii toxin family protein [Cyclobacteriaceae bacterium]